MIRVFESTENLIEAAKENLYLYAPLGLGDQINLEARYWAKVPHGKDDVKLCKVSAFGFAIKNNNCSKILSYSTLVPETWIEAQINEHNKPIISYELERIYEYKKPAPTTFSELENRCQEREKEPLLANYFVTLYTLGDAFCLLERELRKCKNPYEIVTFIKLAISLLTVVFALKIYKDLSILKSKVSFVTQHWSQLLSMW